MPVIDIEQIERILCEEDIEGLLKMGAPSDEYRTEAEMIALAIHREPSEARTESRVAEIIGVILAGQFARDTESPEDHEQYATLAHRILAIGAMTEPA